MAGHNKWSQIKRQKGVLDAKKSKIFGRYARMISIESKKANGNKDAPGLRTAIEKARSENMPLENIERAIKRGIGGEGGSLESVVYEAYGPGGAAIIIECVTDSKNRTTQEIKHLLSLHGGSWAEMGAASWAFKKEGDEYVPSVLVPIEESTRTTLFNLLEALDEHDDVQGVYTNAE